MYAFCRRGGGGNTPNCTPVVRNGFITPLTQCMNVMPRTVTTVSIHPDRAAHLRSIRDERDLPNLDEALAAILEEVDTER